MVLGRLAANPPSLLTNHSAVIERVQQFKLLGLVISDDLQWQAHVDYICAKAAKKLYFLKLLKRAGLTAQDLLAFYTSAVRPVLEYACVVWNHRLTVAQADRIEAIQKRALRIIFTCVHGMPYQFALDYSEVPSLRYRREKLSRDFFTEMLNPSSCIYHLLPPRRDQALVSRLRHCNTYPVVRTRTKKYCSPLLFCLANYQ